jgi:hypothetical protein
MKDPEYPNEECVRVLRSTVFSILDERPSPEMLGEEIIKALHAIAVAHPRRDWREVASHAGLIASLALVLQLDAMARMPPKGPMQ